MDSQASADWRNFVSISDDQHEIDRAVRESLSNQDNLRARIYSTRDAQSNTNHQSNVDQTGDSAASMPTANPKHKNPPKPSDIEEYIEHLDQKMTLPRVFDPAGDTLIYIDPPSMQPEQTEKAYRLYLERSATPIRMKKEKFVSLNSPFFDKAFGASAQFRVLRRRNLVGKLPEGIKYALDLTPPTEGEDAVYLTTELCCSEGVRIWFQAQQRFFVSDTLVGGKDDFLSPAHHLSTFNETGEAGRDKINCVSTNQPFSDQSPVKTESKGKQYSLSLEYCPIRHRSAIERFLLAINGQDPRLDSAPKVWSTFSVAKYFDVAHSPLNDYIVRWLRAAPNTAFLEILPEVSLRIADGLQNSDLCRDEFAILVGEAALASVCRFYSLGDDYPNISTHGRKQGDLPESYRTAIEYTSKTFIDRIKNEFTYLVDDDMSWLQGSSVFRELLNAAVDTELDTDTQELVNELIRAIKSYVRGAIYFLLGSSYITMPSRFGDNGGCEDLFPSPESTHRTWMRLSQPQARIFTRTFWKSLRGCRFDVGISNFDVDNKHYLFVPSKMLCPGAAHIEQAKLFERVYKKDLFYIIRKLKDISRPLSAVALERWFEHANAVRVEQVAGGLTRRTRGTAESLSQSKILLSTGLYEHMLSTRIAYLPTRSNPAALNASTASEQDVLASVSDEHVSAEASRASQNLPATSSEPQRNVGSKFTEVGVSNFRSRVPVQPPSSDTPFATAPYPYYLPQTSVQPASRSLAPPHGEDTSSHLCTAAEYSTKHQDVYCAVPSSFSSSTTLPHRPAIAPWQSSSFDSFYDPVSSGLPNGNALNTSGPKKQVMCFIDSFDLNDLLEQVSQCIIPCCDAILASPDAALRSIGRLEVNLTDTLVCLNDSEFKFLPLWAGGNDDGSGGVFDDSVPFAEAGFRTAGPKIRIGSQSARSNSSNSDYDMASVSGDSSVHTSTEVNDGWTDRIDRRRVLSVTDGDEDSLWGEVYAKKYDEEWKGQGKGKTRETAVESLDSQTIGDDAGDIMTILDIAAGYEGDTPGGMAGELAREYKCHMQVEENFDDVFLQDADDDMDDDDNDDMDSLYATNSNDDGTRNDDTDNDIEEIMIHDHDHDYGHTNQTGHEQAGQVEHDGEMLQHGNPHHDRLEDMSDEDDLVLV
ncbi:hypothetical protein MMC20_000092 [Loxospora ochrophaea]|nr:hypothetical protein [Loxospora ochrophaea]